MGKTYRNRAEWEAEQRYYTIREMAELEGVNQHTVRYLIKHWGLVAYHNRYGVQLIRRVDFEAAMERKQSSALSWLGQSQEADYHTPVDVDNTPVDSARLWREQSREAR